MPLLLTVMLDNDIIVNTRTKESLYKINHVIRDTNVNHTFKIILSGKKDKHTIMDERDRIIESAQFMVENISLGGVNITHLLLSNQELMNYTHSENGYTETKTTPFDSTMGYNGTAELKITETVYKWVFNKYNK
jgi:hypothetical protein